MKKLLLLGFMGMGLLSCAAKEAPKPETQEPAAVEKKSDEAMKEMEKSTEKKAETKTEAAPAPKL
jgi:hypothetical protein